MRENKVECRGTSCGNVHFVFFTVGSGSSTVRWCYFRVQPSPFYSPPCIGWLLWGIGSFQTKVEDESSGRLLALQDGFPASRWREGEPPLHALAPLRGGGGGADGPARGGSAVGGPGRSHEAGVQRWGHRRAREVLLKTRSRQRRRREGRRRRERKDGERWRRRSKRVAFREGRYDEVWSSFLFRSRLGSKLLLCLNFV